MQHDEIITRIRNILNELNVDNSHFTNLRLTRFINEGGGDMGSRLPPAQVPALWDTDRKSLSQGIQLYGFPTDWNRTIKIYITGHKARIYGEDMEDAVLNNSNYEASIADPVVLLPYRENQYKIFPEPGSGGAEAILHDYLRQITELVDDTDVPELPLFAHQWLVDYGIYRALAEEHDERMATFQATYEGHFGGK